MKNIVFYGLLLSLILSCNILTANDDCCFCGTPEWDKKVEDFSFSPREAGMILFCEMQKGRKTINELKSSRVLGVLLCICNDEYVFSNKMPGPSEDWSVSGFYVNGYTGRVRIIFYTSGNPDQYVRIPHSDKNLPNGFPFPAEAYPLVTLSQKEWYQLVKKACPDFPKDELKEWAEKGWEEIEGIRKGMKFLENLERESAEKN